MAENNQIKVSEIPAEQETATVNQQEQQQVPAEVAEPKEGLGAKLKSFVVTKVVPGAKKVGSNVLKIGAGVAAGFALCKLIEAKNSSSSGSSTDDYGDDNGTIDVPNYYDDAVNNNDSDQQ